MLVKLVKDMVKTQTVTCGEVDMTLVIREASDVNRLCVLLIPGFLGEVPSDEL